jgi:hypothetical protein
MAWLPGDEVVQVAWFTSEADARKGESAELPPDVAEYGRAMDEVMEDVSFVDLRDPWMA